MLFIAKMNGKIIGFISARLIAPEMEIFNIAVLPEFRKQGIGGKLFGQILDCAVKNEAKVCWLEVRESNKIARKFYENLKFEIVGKRKNYYTNPAEDAILLEFKIGN
jgi:ribosomal-protein-alanine N-acetyltransferase